MPTSQALGTQGRKRQKTLKAQQRETLTSERATAPRPWQPGQPCPEGTAVSEARAAWRGGAGKAGRPAVQSVHGTVPGSSSRRRPVPVVPIANGHLCAPVSPHHGDPLAEASCEGTRLPLTSPKAAGPYSWRRGSRAPALPPEHRAPLACEPPRPHLAGSSLSCRAEVWVALGVACPGGSLHRRVPPAVEEDVGVTRHDLALVHRCHCAVVKQAPACGKVGRV